MAQKLRAFTFQFNPSAMLTNMAYRRLNNDGQALLFRLYMEYWENPGTLPSDPKELAIILSKTEEEIACNLPSLAPLVIDENGFIVVPELRDYREHLDERRKRQSEGGRVGALKTNAAQGIRGVAGKPPGKPQHRARVSRRVSRSETSGSLVEQSRVEQSRVEQSRAEQSHFIPVREEDGYLATNGYVAPADDGDSRFDSDCVEF